MKENDSEGFDTLPLSAITHNYTHPLPQLGNDLRTRTDSRHRSSVFSIAFHAQPPAIVSNEHQSATLCFDERKRKRTNSNILSHWQGHRMDNITGTLILHKQLKKTKYVYCYQRQLEGGLQNFTKQIPKLYQKDRNISDKNFTLLSKPFREDGHA